MCLYEVCIILFLIYVVCINIYVPTRGMERKIKFIKQVRDYYFGVKLCIVSILRRRLDDIILYNFKYDVLMTGKDI